MTEEQKDILIAKMLDEPSSLSDKELESILIDEELRDIYEMSSALSGAYIDKPDFDMADEWNRFRPKIRRKPIPMRWVMRIAAIFLGVVFVGGIMVRITDKVLNEPQPKIAKVLKIKKSAEIKSVEKYIKSDEIPQKEDSKSPIPSNNAVSSCQHSLKTKTFKTRQIEMPEENIDIDEYLRIQQARIDNDLAMMAAESYIYEYNEFLQDLDDTDSFDTTELDNALRQVTIQ
ncbi:MAG: hypothetical protein K2I08_09220 [Muribaculaceae bacterium]|nr:hypothetical protein [Muribaculaceae bacterium]MDE6522425.1 hypothetical protein [Muribaculaceae bacterium]